MKRQKKQKFTSLFLRQQAEKATGTIPDLVIEAEKAVAHILSGNHYQRKPGTGEKFWQFRPYDPSDRPQDIDWRQSARGDTILTRQKEWQTTQTTYIWCQNDASMDFKSQNKIHSKTESACILALALALLLNRSGELVGNMAAPDKPGRHESHLQQLAESFLTQQTETITADTVRQNASVVLLGDFLAPLSTYEKTFKTLRGKSSHGMVIQILDPAELTLPYTGRAIFTDRIKNKAQQIENIEDIKEEYLKHITDHNNRLEHLCHSHRWLYLQHNTANPIHEALHSAMQKLERHTV